jgi:hypothetical protein
MLFLGYNTVSMFMFVSWLQYSIYGFVVFGYNTVYMFMLFLSYNTVSMFMLFLSYNTVSMFSIVTKKQT